MSDNGAGKKESNGQEIDIKELTRLLHDVADAQIRMAQLIDAFWTDLRGFVRTCEKAAQEIRAAARDVEKATGDSQSTGRSRQGEGGSQQDRSSGRNRTARRRPIRIGGGGREQGNRPPPTHANRWRSGSRARRSGPGQDAEQEAAELSDELLRLVGEAQRLVDLLNRK